MPKGRRALSRTLGAVEEQDLPALRVTVGMHRRGGHAAIVGLTVSQQANLLGAVAV